MRKNLTKKLFLSVLTLAFAVVSLGASTYAWFTLSESAELEAFEGQVTAGESGLEIQVTGFETDGSITAPVDGNWSSTTIKEDVIKTVIGNNVSLTALQFNSADYTFDKQEKVLEGKTDKVGVLNKDYIAFNIHFRLADSEASDAAVALYLNTLEITTEGAPADGNGEWYASKTYTDGDGSTITQGKVANPYYVGDAARVALRNNTDSNSSKIYEAKESEGSSHYTSNTYTNGAHSYYKEVHELADAPTAPASYGTGVASHTETNEQVGLLPADGTHLTLTVYVWVDGWDAECINNIFKQLLSVHMIFTIDNN